MRHLVIDTATEALSVALFEDGGLIGHSHEIAGRGHAEKLVPAIASLPDGGKAEEIWVDSGPGSFTGIRVGVAAARALSYAWGAHLKSYSSLSLLATMARHEGTEKTRPLSIALTGGHGELFWQQFDQPSLTPLAAVRSIPISELAGATDAPAIYGTGAQALTSVRGFGEARILHPDARAAILLPPTHLYHGADAYYGRGADALPPASTRST